MSDVGGACPFIPELHKFNSRILLAKEIKHFFFKHGWNPQQFLREDYLLNV